MSRQVGWKVYRPSKKVYQGWVYWDTVFFTPDCDANYVYSSLVEHDGYPPDIRVEKSGNE